MKKWIFIRIWIVVIMILVWFYFYNKLPNEVPTHWNFEWKPDNWWSKIFFLTLIPAITLWMALLFPLLAKIDPKKKNYKKFESAWEIFQYIIVWFMAYVYFVSIYVILNPTVNISTFIMVWIWILFIIIWNYMWKIKQNFFIWMKLPWTLDNEEVWNKTHRFSGKIFMLWGLILIINAFLKWQILWVFIFAILLILIVPALYSYFEFQKQIKK